MGKIFAAVLKRPESNESRTAATNAVYDCTRALLQPNESGRTLEVDAEIAVRNWQKMYEDSKEENTLVVAH